MNEEYCKQLKLTYEQLCRYLQDKYGFPGSDYFANERCVSKVQKNSRTSEGLFIHHNAEGLRYVGNLGHPKLANYYPFEYQRRENLTYCNYIEHLILHLKINANSKSSFGYPFEIRKFFNSHGFFWIGADINNLYLDNGSYVEWRNNCFKVIKDDFDSYLKILRGTLAFVDENYYGDREIQIKKGEILTLEELMLVPSDELLGVIMPDKYTRYSLKIDKVEKARNTVLLVTKSGAKVQRNHDELVYQTNFDDIMDDYAHVMSSLNNDREFTLLYEELKKPLDGTSKEIASWSKDSIEEYAL